MLKIRLTRRGKKNSAFFRVVVAEHTAPIKGKFLENLGFLNPHTKEKEFKADRIKYWIEKGAQCSDTVHNLLVSNEIVKGPKKAVKIKKKPEAEKKEETGEKKPVETAEEKPGVETKAEEKKDIPEEKKAAPEENKPAEVAKAKEGKPEEKKSEEKPDEKSESEKMQRKSK